MMVEDLEQKFWYRQLDGGVKDLLREAVLLIEKVALWTEHFSDYSFVVFPAAKAYEGYLKKVFLDLGFISNEDYLGKRFRVGKALNPSLEAHLRHESVYDKLVDFCQGEELAQEMWNTWKFCRNLLFHFFPNEKNAITFNEAKERVITVITTMEAVAKGCKIKKNEKS